MYYAISIRGQISSQASLTIAYLRNSSPFTDPFGIVNDVEFLRCFGIIGFLLL